MHRINGVLCSNFELFLSEGAAVFITDVFLFSSQEEPTQGQWRFRRRTVMVSSEHSLILCLQPISYEDGKAEVAKMKEGCPRSKEVSTPYQDKNSLFCYSPPNR